MAALRAGRRVPILVIACVFAAGTGLGGEAPRAAANVPGAGPSELQEVVVTGSRLITNGNDSPTPLTVVQVSELDDLRPTTLADGLNNLPVFSGSSSQGNVGNPTGAFSGGNNTANQLNMRNMGAIRNLVLFDGQRLAPSLTLGTVDVDVIPQMLIQRVDIVTGGVAAVYGSDAVSGVVNFVTDKNFNGVKVDLNGAVSSRHDDRSTRFGIAGGMPLFGGRGHIEGSYSYFDNRGIDLRTDRPYFPYAALGSVPGSTANPGTAANPFQIYYDVRNAQQSYGGLVSGGALNGLSFDTNGVLTPFVAGVRTGTNNQQIGGGGIYNNVELIGPLRYHQLFARFDFNLSDSLHWHTQASHNWTYNSNTGITTSLNPFTFSARNPFLAASYQATLAAANQTTFSLRKTFPLGTLPYPDLSAKATHWHFNTGLEGKLGRYDWGADFNYGQSTLRNSINNNPNLQRLAAALDVISDPTTGLPVCRALANNPGCVPFNAFGPTAASAEAMNYVIGSTQFTPHWFMADANAHISGTLFNDWAGPVKGALSAEWRQLTYSSNTSPGATPTTFANCTGIQYNCTQGTTTLWSSIYAARSPVSNTVKEGALEFDLPLLKDVRFVKGLNLNGAARFTSYETSGNYWTWKLGGIWHLNDAFTVRSTVSRDIRAPTLYELFRSEVQVPVAVTDLLTNTAPNVPSRDLAAPFDTAEIALTRMLGVVWQPTPGWSLSLDAFRIKIDNAIAQVQGFNAASQNACYASGGSSFYCTLQTRPSNNFTNTSSTNLVTAWLNYFMNISSIETYGVDVETNWSGRAFGHRVDARLLATYQPHLLYAQPGLPTYDLAGVAFPNVVGQQVAPSIRAVGMLTVGITDKLAVGLEERWRNAMLLDPVTTNVWVPGANHMASFALTTLNLSFKSPQSWGELQIYGNIRNLFDRKAPIGTTGNQPGNAFALSDDIIGRYYTLGLRIKL